MSEAVKRAKYLLVTEKGALGREKLLINGIFAGLFICRAVFCAFLFSEEVYFFGYYLPSEIFIALSGSAFFMLLYFYSAHRLHFTAGLFYLADKSFDEPYRFMKPSVVLRYGVFLTVKAAVNILWLSFFMLPAVFISAVIVRVFVLTGNMQRVMFFALLSAVLFLFIAGIFFFLRVRARYFMSELLFMRNPRQSPFALLKNSAALTGERFSGKSVLRAYSCFVRGSIYGKLLFALFVSDKFFEREYYRSFGIFQPNPVNTD